MRELNDRPDSKLAGLDYQQLVETVPVCVYMLDTKGRFAFANEELHRLLELPLGSLVGQHFSEILHPQDLETLRHCFHERRTGDRATKSHEVRVIAADGGCVDVQLRCRFLRLDSSGVYSDGDFVGTCGIARDIAEEKEKLAQLDRRMRRYRRLVDEAPATIAVESAGRLTYVNETGAAMVGVDSPESLVGEDLLPLIPEEEREQIADVLRQCDGVAEGDWQESRLLRRDGSALDVEYAYRPTEFDGKPAAEIVVRDVTRRKRVERERQTLQRLSQRLTTSIDARELSITLAAESRQLFGHDAFSLDLVNRAGATIEGVYREDTAVGGDGPQEMGGGGRREGRLFWLDGGEAALINRTESENGEAPLKTFGHRERRSRSLMFAPIRWENETLGVVTVQSYTDDRYNRDDLGLLQSLADHCGGCLARLNLEAAKTAAEDELKERRAVSMRSDRLRSLGEMAAGIAHELNQPLVGVRGLAEHLLVGIERGWDITGEKAGAKIASIMRQADRMEHIIQHVRVFARDAGRPETCLVDVNHVLAAAQDMLGAQLTSRGMRLRLELADDLPEVMANPYSLEEAVVNLLINARDATEDEYQRDGGGTLGEIVMRSRWAGQNGSRPVQVQVIDRGTGIPSEVQRRVFEPFFTTKGPDRGTGLGLSVTQGIVEEIGGILELESEPGKGTKVTMSLPSVVSAERAMD